MPDKGRIISQTFYEKQSKLIKLYKESFLRKEMDVNEAITSLRVIGFSEKMADNKVREWVVLPNENKFETERAVKQRFKQQDSLEKYVFNIIFDKKCFNENDKKYFNEHKLLKSKYLKNELSKDDCANQLMHSGYRQEYVKCIISRWDKE